MLRFIWAQLRGRPRRALALLAGILVATVGFTVLSASAAASQLRTTGTVQQNYRAAYDILVRPKGSRTALEDQRGLVRPNYLSGMFGGISLRQLDQVRAVSHVEVAAPIAMLGYLMVRTEQAVDLTEAVDRTAQRQLLKLTPSWLADRGLTVLGDAPYYIYLTRNPLYGFDQPPGQEATAYTDGTPIPPDFHGCGSVLEVSPDRGKQPICTSGGPPEERTPSRVNLQTWQLQPDGTFVNRQPVIKDPAGDRLVVKVTWEVMVLAAAVDPPSEAALVDLDQAVTAGRYLTRADDTTTAGPDPIGNTFMGIPTLLASKPYVDEQVKVDVDRMPATSEALIHDRQWAAWEPTLAAAPATPAGPPTRSTGPPRLDVKADSVTGLAVLFQSGSTQYQADQGSLRPRPVPLDPTVWQVPGGGGIGYVVTPPVYATDTGFRPVTRLGTVEHEPSSYPVPDVVGQFDPDKLRGFSPLSTVPLETYQAPQASGADPASRQLLGGKPLQPNSNPAGYLASPPLLLTNLTAVGHLPLGKAQVGAPVSAIRVRVAGVAGFDAASRERVRVVAEDIAAATGLDVDITIGSSQAPQTVVLPAGTGGRPSLALSEEWSRKGVAVTVVQAADRKSLLLFGLILLVCVLFLGNAVGAAVRDRRRELAVLACLGWPARRLAAAILGEVALVGLVAGVLAAAIALPLPGQNWLLAVPVGMGLALLAAAVPALSAARARPGAAVHPAVLGVRRARERRTVVGLALGNLARVPARTALGVVALAVGVGALTMLGAVAVAFHNDVIGTVLGDAVSVRVRSVDVIAAVAAVLLGTVATGDVLYINVRERSAELAALWAGGWSDRALLRLVGYEGLAIGVLGGLLGAGAGLGAVAWFVGAIDAAAVWLAVLAAGGAVLVAALAAVVPALLLRRFPLSTLLAEE